jgi:sulfatase modifying factor 1
MKANAPSPLPKIAPMVWIEGGTFTMGSDHFYPEEAPPHRVTVGGFWIDPFPVTNAEFALFLEATEYVTLAERPPKPKDYPGSKQQLLAPSSIVFVKPQGQVDARNSYQWWRYVPGASWRHPFGRRSSIEGLEDHPVVHVAYEDVEAYCAWIGKELPSEAEWEFAARGGLEGADYAWGDEFEPDGQIMANTWQGDFPTHNLLKDGYEYTSPVGSFPPNKYGLYDMIGNVWEWTADWYGAKYYEQSPAIDPPGPPVGDTLASKGVDMPTRTIRGGAWIGFPGVARASYRYWFIPTLRVANIGFRCVLK